MFSDMLRLAKKSKINNKKKSETSRSCTSGSCSTLQPQCVLLIPTRAFVLKAEHTRLQPHRLVADAPEHGPMEQRVKPARIQSSLCPQPEQQQHLDLLTSGYWVIPVSPGLPAVTWAHLHADFVPTASLPSRPRTLVWTPTRLWTLWSRLEMAFKNFGGAILDAHFFEDGSEEMRLYSSGARALLWRGLLNTLHPGQRIQDPEERWFRGCGLVWRTLDGKKVMIA